MSYENPSLGETMPFGCETRIYTLRGWVVCENQKEVDEEKKLIQQYLDGLKKEGKEWQGE